MPSLAKTRFLLLIGLLLALPTHRGFALLNIDGTRNQVFVFGSVSYAYSSNIFSESSERGDSSVTGGVGIEIKRRAGLIAVNATAKFDYQRYAKYTDESALTPNFYIEFNKSSGVLTGALTVNAYRESRAESAVNLRAKSWNFPVSLSLRYPINEKFYLATSTGYLQRRYEKNSSLTNYSDVSQAVDLFYRYTSKLDLLGGYRIRASKTAIGSNTYDHWFNLGASSDLFGKLSGTVRFGYQIRDSGGGATNNQFNGQVALNWTATRKFSANAQASRDFNTIATGSSIDATTAALRATYVFTRKAEASAGVSYGRNRFIEGAQPGRRDHSFGWDFAARYQLNDHLRFAASYSSLKNWSSIAASTFERQGFSFDVSSRF